MKIIPASLSNQDASHLVTDVVEPRPIAWVSTVDAEGRTNLAPFSAYGFICNRPMIVGFSVATKRDGAKKDTICNIEATGEYVISVITYELAEKMNQTAAGYPHDVSEFAKAGLTPVKADIVKAPLVAESPLSMECRVINILEFGKMPSLYSYIIGEVMLVHVKDEYFNKQSKRVSGLRLIGRLGGEGDLYCRAQDTFEMKRPTP
jgi:flavin reductase (DIM6/NTAB) family NADH-FMN oxidoreductase RutF